MWTTWTGDSLGVDLSKHEELNIVRRPAQLLKDIYQVLHFGFVQTEALFFVIYLEDLERVTAIGKDVDNRGRRGNTSGEHDVKLRLLESESLSHPVVEDVSKSCVLSGLVFLLKFCHY